MTPAQAAARLAGGFFQPIEHDSLNDALRAVLADRSIDLGELAPIRDLPGMVRAASRTLQRVWNAGIDLKRRLAEHDDSRLAALVRLEKAVVARLPAAMLRPSELVVRALTRLDFAAQVLGPVTLVGFAELDSVWRAFINGLAGAVPVSWQLGAYAAPKWLNGAAVKVEAAPVLSPNVVRVSCANPRHEAIEALRWARELIATRHARPEQIAIAAPSTKEWDGHLAAIVNDTSLPVAFVHGRSGLDTRDGQAAAALAEVLANGISRQRIHRLLALVRGMTASTAQIPEGWQRILAGDAPLLKSETWRRMLEGIEAWPEGRNFSRELLAVIKTLEPGIDVADEAGEKILAGRALAIWRKALREGPAHALDLTLREIRVDDDLDPASSIVWCSAAELAACPRPYVRLLGLTSSQWPRNPGEDPLLPSSVIDPRELDPIPLPERDRRDFEAILRTSAIEVCLSRSRRNADGRQTGISPLLRKIAGSENPLLRERTPEHTVSEADRLLARPAEFRATRRAAAAMMCWSNWRRSKLTPHDGLVRPRHPMIEKAFRRPLSATGLQLLVRDPMAFLWKHVLGWSEPSEDEEPLAIDAMTFGSLTHRTLELAAIEIESSRGFAPADKRRIRGAVRKAIKQMASAAADEQPLPPSILWNRTLDEIEDLAFRALSWPEAPLPGQRSFAEIPFGRTYDSAAPISGLPWDPRVEVTIPGTNIAIQGWIDRLDVSRNRQIARVTDYKTGTPPKSDAEISVEGGNGLQRCLYAYAVEAMLGERVEVAARLLYPREGGGMFELRDSRATLEAVAKYLVAARDHLLEGHAVPTEHSKGFSGASANFALPASAKESYIDLKAEAARRLLAPLPKLWEMP